MRCLACLLLISACTPTVVVTGPSPSERACDAFSESVTQFSQSLITSADAPPRANPETSPERARAMGEAAAACLTARHVAFSRTPEQAILIDATNEQGIPAHIADVVTAKTGGLVLYDPSFFLARPYAAAAFDKETNILYLPHAAVLGQADRATRHELRHVESLASLRSGARVRNVLLQNQQTTPNHLALDEVFAYASFALDAQSDGMGSPTEQDAQWSLAHAAQYVTMATQALNDPSTSIRLDGATQWCPLSASDRERIGNVLSCVQSALDAHRDVNGCDTETFAPSCR